MTSLGSLPLRDQVEHLKFMLAEVTAPQPEWLALASRFGVSLTQQESRVLGAMMRHAPQTMTRNALLSAIVWDRGDAEEPDCKIVDVYICKLRAKIAGHGIGRVETVWGVGYRWVPAS